MFARVLIFGYGAMASAVLEGWLASGLPPRRFTAYNPRPKPVPTGVVFVDEVPSGPFDAVVLGVKPQVLASVAEELAPLLGRKTVLLSLLAAGDLDHLAKLFPAAGAWVRMMPNLAAAIGKSPVALAGRGLSEVQRVEVTDLADRLGGAEWLADEAHFAIVTALVGSGPGFVYRFIDALAKGAAALGLPPAQAERLAVRMVAGAGALAAVSGRGPAELAGKVASPGGTTQAGLSVLDDNGALHALVARCLVATEARGRELAATLRTR